MFDLNNIQQAVAVGRSIDPSFINTRRLVKNNRVRIENRVQSTDRSVDPSNIIVTILSILNLSPDMNYEEVEWRAIRSLARISNSLGLNSYTHYGKPTTGNIIAGQDELIALVAKAVEPNMGYHRYSPIKFLYHGYTNLDWRIGDRNIIDDINIVELNLVALAWQYVKYLKSLRGDTRKLSLRIYVYRYVIYRALPSYFNISLYNRHIKFNDGVDYPDDRSNSELQTPHLDQPVNKHIALMNNYFKKGDMLPAELLGNIRFMYDDVNARYPNAIELINFTADATDTLQRKWLYTVIRMKYVGDVLRFGHRSADAFKPRLKRELAVLRQTRAVEKMPKHLSLHINRLILEPLDIMVN